MISHLILSPDYILNGELGDVCIIIFQAMCIFIIAHNLHCSCHNSLIRKVNFHYFSTTPCNPRFTRQSTIFHNSNWQAIVGLRWAYAGSLEKMVLRMFPRVKKQRSPHTHYVSFFYAFEPRPPFNLRGRSGYFCLGFAGERRGWYRGWGIQPTFDIDNQSQIIATQWNVLVCPQIHFVSSFDEKVVIHRQVLLDTG